MCYITSITLNQHKEPDMKFSELLDQASEHVAPYRRTIFKTFVIALATGGNPGRVSSVFRRFAGVLIPSGISRKKFYNFINSAKIPWTLLWGCLAKLVAPYATVAGRLLVALDDTTYGKTGKHIAGCASHFDHAAKQNWSKWIFGHCRVVAGILAFGHGRWMCLPFVQKPYQPLPKNVKDSKKLSRAEWLKTKSGIGACLVIRLVVLFKRPALIVCDSWFGTRPLLDEARQGCPFDVHILSRLRVNSTLYDLPRQRKPGKRGRGRKYGEKLPAVRELAAGLKRTARTAMIHIYGKKRECLFSEIICMSGALKCKVKIVFIYRQGNVFPLITTDLSLAAEQCVEYYSARWKIESGFKELKHEIGALDSQCRNDLAVENHFDLCCFAASMAWIYALHSETAPARLHPTRRSNAFAFADVRRQIAAELKTGIFNRGCPETVIPAVKFICSAIFRMTA
jgi:hypothetical protein